MAKKTDVITKVIQNEAEQTQKTEQPPVNLNVPCTIERVQFPPVDELESLAKVGFVCERLSSDAIAEPLYRLCIEVNRGEVENLPKALTPWMPANSLSVAITGVMYLQPLLVQEIKAAQANAEEPKSE